jgi:uncharacterized RDD family membrane protein YckC
LSKSATTKTFSPAWKQEVNRRVAAHMNQNTPPASESKGSHNGRPVHGSRAAQAAARVAERYANAPSYSQILAEEARAAVRAAEAASIAAQEAQAVVQSMLDDLEAARSPEAVLEPEREPEVDASTASRSREASGPRAFDVPLVPKHALAGPALKRDEVRQTPASPEVSTETWEDSGGTDAGEPIYANLIQFPRPMIATRRLRPRRAEGPLATVSAEPQLSIFEVDPGSISTISTEPAPAVDEPAAPVWMRAEARSIELDPQPAQDLLEESTTQPSTDRLKPAPLKIAPLSRRLMGFIIDVSLISAISLVIAQPFASHMEIPGAHTIELAAGFAMLAIGIAYQVLFLTLARATPGMRYAGIALCTFDGQHPSRAQQFGRVIALLLSVLPVGLGLAWAFFDDDYLMGHDRLSKTYMRKR